LIGTAAPMASKGQTITASSPIVGDGTLVAAPGSPYTIGSRASVLAPGDFNGDGLPDLVIATSGLTSTLTVLIAARDGGFTPAPASPISVEWETTGLTVGDFNKDGKLDIAVTGYALSLTGVQVFLGDGQGGFFPTTPIQASSFGMNNVSGVGVGDFNHDGDIDLAVAGAESVGSNSTGYVAILLGDGTGNFASAVGGPFQTAAVPKQVTVADFNMDGDLDVGVTNELANEVDILLGEGNGKLVPDSKGPFPTGNTPIAIVHGDFNNDGKPDLAVANWFAGTLTVLLGDGTAGFTRQPDVAFVPTGYAPEWLAVGDIDGDGALDIAVAVAGDPPISELFILFGDGMGRFQGAALGIFNFAGGPVGVALADFNGDGRLDVATANYGTGTASVFLGAPVLSAINLMVSASTPAPTVGAPFQVIGLSQPSGFEPPTGTVTLHDGSTVVSTESFDLGTVVFGVTASTAGVHTLVATYPGDLRTGGSTSSPLTVNIGKGNQTISFPPPPNYPYGDAPFEVAAFASSGLPVTLTVISGPAKISGSLLTLTGVGTVTLQASQTGNANYLPAPIVQQQFQVVAAVLNIDAVLNAASYSVGAFAPNSFATIFGSDLASLTSKSGGLATILGGTSIQISDASGELSNALLYFASPAQINLVLPPNLRPGTGRMTVETQAGPSATTPITIAAVSPGLFSADASGTGVASGSALLVSADGTQTPLPINNCTGTPLVCTAIPINLGSDSDTVYLTLYGTGIRGRSALSAVTATIGGVSANVQYAGAQPQFPGLDQVNLQISPALRGRGNVRIALAVDGIAANVVTVAIQ